MKLLFLVLRNVRSNERIFLAYFPTPSVNIYARYYRS